MHIRCRAGVTAIFLVAAHTTQATLVDDGDPGIEYRGTWVHDPIEDPKDLYGGSMTFSNVSGSTATYRFGGIGIAVFGAFEVVGTFAMHSTYSIDGGPAVDFIPASTIVRASYRQRFFQSDTLSDGEHTLVITNEGQEFWLDYLLVTPVPQSTTTALISSASRKTQPLLSSTAQASPPTAGPATPSSTSSSHPEISQSLLGPISQKQATQWFSNTSNMTLTSANAADSAPSPAGSTSRSQTSTLVSGITSPSGTPARAHSTRISAGAIVGLCTAVLLVTVLVGLVGWRSCRGRKQAGSNDLAPYDMGLTALAFESSEKQGLARDSGSRGSMAISLLSLPVPQAVPAHLQAKPGRGALGRSGEYSVPHEIWTTGLSGMVMGRDRSTGFEPLGSSSSPSPLLARYHRETLDLKGAPFVRGAGQSRYVGGQDERRRSIDGGTRIAGGPLESLRQGDADDDIRSGLSTLPPSYQMYPGA